MDHSFQEDLSLLEKCGFQIQGDEIQRTPVKKNDS